jgi:Flp pilus assembly protein TadD
MPQFPSPPGSLGLRVKAVVRRLIESVLGLVAMKLRGSAAIPKYLAVHAAENGDHEAALRWWKEVGKRRLDWAIAYVGQARSLRGLNRLDDVRRTLQEGVARFPGNVVLMVDLGWLLVDLNELEQALPIWRRAVQIAPDQPACHVGLATTLRQMLCFDEADATLAAAGARFPESCVVFSNHAVSADLRGDRMEALRRWQVVSDRFPDEPIAYAGLGAAHKALGRFDQADTILARGMELFPADANVAINHAWVAVTAADWPEAMRRWSALRSKWPDDTLIRTGLSEASMQAKLAAADEAAGFSQDIPVYSDDGDDARELIMGFESIGENCELGFVQRHFEAEPLGLFRWAGIAFDRLLEALENDFAGIGADENTVLNVNPNNHEYFTEDLRYGMSLHSFILEGDVAAEVVKMKLCRRISYLKDKFIQDLKEGSKIFVFNTMLPLSDEELRRLHAGLCQYGPVSLLHVAPHADPRPGTVIEVDARLWRGSLGRTGCNGRIWEIEFDTWLTICQTIRLLNAAHAQAISA